MMDEEMRERLVDDEALQQRLVTYTRNRKRYSHDWLSNRHETWREQERTERLFKEPDDSDKETRAENLTEGVQKIVVPTSYAQLWSMLAFLMNALNDRSPMIPVDGVGSGDAHAALLHELLLQYQWDNQPRQRGQLVLLQWLHDSLRYGIGVVHNAWDLRIFNDFIRNIVPVMIGGQIVGYDDQLEERDVVSYEGNASRNIQPYDWLPDPRTGSLALFQEGEFCGHTFTESHTRLCQLEDEGLYAGVDLVPDYSQDTQDGGNGQFWQDSELGNLTDRMDSMPATAYIDADGEPFKRCASLYAWVYPRELRLPDYGQSKSRSALWLFTLANDQRVIRAERANLPGRKFPYAAFESNYDVHAPANPGHLEVISGLAYIASWLFNSRMANVRRSLNVETLLDPSMVERNDWSRSNPSGIWRLTKGAMQSGIPLDHVAKQLPIQDVTTGHLQDSSFVQSLIEQTTGASRQIQGLANPGRRAATEVQGQLSLAAGRMRLVLHILAAQGLIDLAEQQIANNRAFLEQRLTIRIRDERYAKILGQDYVEITPELVQGTFRVPLLEPGIPTDKNMHASVLKEMLAMGMQAPQVAQQMSSLINFPELFFELMRTINKRNLKDFVILPQPGGPGQPGMPQMQTMPGDQVQRQQQAGNLVPVAGDGFPYLGGQQGMPGMGGNGNAAPGLQ